MDSFLPWLRSIMFAVIVAGAGWLAAAAVAPQPAEASYCEKNYCNLSTYDCGWWQYETNCWKTPTGTCDNAWCGTPPEN